MTPPEGLRRAWIMTRHEARLTRSSMVPVVAYLVMPLVLMAFLRDSFGAYLRATGHPSASGAELVVPGQAATFGYFLNVSFGVFLFSEHSWRTWDRLRAGPASTSEIIGGKLVVWSGHMGLQFAALMAAGALLLGFEVSGSLAALAAVTVATVATTLAFGAMAFTVSPSKAIFDAACYAGGLLLAATGGAIVPSGLLPTWVRPIAPLSPVHWSMNGFQAAVFGGGDPADVLEPTLVLLGFTAVFAAVALWRFDPAAPKRGRQR